MIEFLQHADGAILLFIQEVIRNPVLTSFFVFITSLGNGGMIWIVAGLLLLIPKKTRKTGILVLVSLFASWLFNNLLLKNAFARTRPYEVVEGLICLVERPRDFSFPSGHTASSFAAAVVIFLRMDRKAGIPAIVLAILIAVSRLYVGVHYPTDVLFGFLSGTVIACLTVTIAQKFSPDHSTGTVK